MSQLKTLQKHIAARLEVLKDEVGSKEDLRVLLDAAKAEAEKASKVSLYTHQTLRALTPLARLAVESVGLVVDTLLPNLTRVERVAALQWIAECCRITMRERGVKAVTAETILAQLNRDPYRVIEESFPGYVSKGLIETVFKNYCRIKVKPSDKEE